MNVDLRYPNHKLTARQQYQHAWKVVRFLERGDRSVYAYMRWVSLWNGEHRIRQRAVHSLIALRPTQPTYRSLRNGLQRIDSVQKNIRRKQAEQERIRRLREAWL